MKKTPRQIGGFDKIPSVLAAKDTGAAQHSGGHSALLVLAGKMMDLAGIEPAWTAVSRSLLAHLSFLGNEPGARPPFGSLLLHINRTESNCVQNILISRHTMHDHGNILVLNAAQFYLRPDT